MKNAIIFLLLIIYGNLAQAQNDSILNDFDNQNKLKWLSVLPSINYNALDNSFSIGLSMSNLTNYYQTKERNKIERRKLLNQMQEDADKKAESIKQKIIDFEIAYNSVVLDTTTLSITNQLFSITKGKYQNGEITTEEYLTKKLAVLNQYKSILKTCAQIQRKGTEIKELNQNQIFEHNIKQLIKIVLQMEKNLTDLKVVKTFTKKGIQP